MHEHTRTHTHTHTPPPPPTYHTTTKRMDGNQGRYKAEQVSKLEINVQAEEGYRSKQKG